MRKGTGRKLEEVDIDREANGITLLTACRHPSFELADQGSPKSQKLLSPQRYAYSKELQQRSSIFGYVRDSYRGPLRNVQFFLI